MATQTPHRLLVVVPLAPAGQFTALRTFWAASVVEAGDGPDDPATWPGLNAAGDTGPATHRWWSAGLKDAVCKAILVKACQIGGQTPPTNVQWNGWTAAEKVAWLKTVRDALLAATGIWLDLCPQVGAKWTDPEAALTKTGVKRQQSAATPNLGK